MTHLAPIPSPGGDVQEALCKPALMGKRVKYIIHPIDRL